MKIVEITPGSGDNFYCENCLRDRELAKALGRSSHEIMFMPLYLPVKVDSDAVRRTPIFFGGINVYLQQKLNFFRKSPRILDFLFDRKIFLKLAARKAGMTSASDLGQTTVSMLRGSDGRQVKELERLVNWLGRKKNKPDVIWLSNALLTGMAETLRTRLGVPIICMLHDEDGFIDGLTEPYASQAWDLITKHARDNVDAFISVSKYYADLMKDRLSLDDDKVHVVYPGVDMQAYDPAVEKPKVPTIGFLSRLCFGKGLDTLVEAFVALKRNPKLKNARLLIAGGSTGNDEVFIRMIHKRLESCRLTKDVDFWADFDHKSKQEFFSNLSVLSVPEKHPTACGLYVIEAMAAAVPVVQPASGGFPEIIELTNGGITCQPNNAVDLAAALERFLLDPEYAQQTGLRGHNAVAENFNIDKAAENIVHICDGLLEKNDA